MRVTRFINGKKVEKGFTQDIVIENELITSTIERINNRFAKGCNTAEKGRNSING